MEKCTFSEIENDIRISCIHKIENEEIVYPRTMFVKVEHIPSGITVTKMHKSQVVALNECIKEIDILINNWSEHAK